MSLSLKNVTPQHWLILVVILVVGLGLRVYRLDRYSIFFDEKSTMVVSQGIVLEGANQKKVFSTPKITLAEFWHTPGYPFRIDRYTPKPVLRSLTFNEEFPAKSFTPAEFWAPKTLADYYEAMTRSDIGNSAFYYLILHWWLEIFGLSDFSARFLSVLFSMGIIWLTFLFGRRFFSTSTGLIGAGIAAVEPFFIAYSHQARNYSLTFFLTLLATYLFLQIIDNRDPRKNTLSLYLGYTLAAGLGVLSHFLVISVLITHALYALFFLRSFSGWIKMGVSAALALSGVAWWLVFGGGQYTLYSLNYQAALYKRVAEEMPRNNPFGEVLPATLTNVFNKALPIFADLIIFTNNLTDSLGGKKYVLLSLSVGIVLILWYRFRNKIAVPDWLKNRLPFALVLVTGFFYPQHKLQFAIFSVSIFALSFLPDIHKKADKTGRRRLWMLYTMALFPTFFLIAMAFRGGHTFGLQQRYSGFSFPYVILIISLLLQYYRRLQFEYQALIYLFLIAQMYFVGLRLKEFYEDRSVKYGYFANPRVPNPHYAAAQKIKATYQLGDTIFYPAPRFPILGEMDRTYLPYSVQDAQLTNLYLPKDATYIQTMDTTQIERIWIKRKGQAAPIEIMKLKGFRYGSE